MPHPYVLPMSLLQNERGIAPLGIAVGFNRAAIVSLLLEKGAQVDRRDPAGNTVLHYAAGGWWWWCPHNLYQCINR